MVGHTEASPLTTLRGRYRSIDTENYPTNGFREERLACLMSDGGQGLDDPVQLVLSVDNMNGSVAGRESLNGVAEPGHDFGN